MSSGLISVIIPVFNAGGYLVSSIESVLRQSYRDLEIIICDDASTDNSLNVLQSFHDSRIKIVRNETNRGYLRTINLLLEISSGDYIAFHDADDVSQSERLAHQVRFLNTHSDIALVGTNFNIINEGGKIIHQHPVQLTDPLEIKSTLMQRNVFQKPSILFRRRVYEKVGGFREGFLKLKNISEDYDWLLRASEHFQLSNVNGDEPLYSYRSVSSAMSKSFSNVDQLFGHKIAQYLAVERRQGGTDSLDRGDFDRLSNMLDEWRLPYQKDRSLFHHERAEAMLYYGLFRQAMQWAWSGWLIDPLNKRNARTLASAIKNNLKRLL